MSTSSFRLAGTFLLALAFLAAGCGGDDPASSPRGTPSPPETSGNTPPDAAPTEIATGDDTSEGPANTTEPEATDEPPHATPTDGSPRIQFVDGFAEGAARAKEGDVLFVYVGLHDPT